jgi:stalled ribosome rescue protein Dom34
MGEFAVALRIKARWHDDNADRSLDEIASAIAFNAWRIAKDKAITLHGEDFVYDSDEQRFGVIREYLVFQLQLVDRIAHQRLGLDDSTRQELVVTTAKNMAKHLHDNSVDVFGPGDHVKNFVELINKRGAEYAEFGFSEDGPSYPFMRHLGYEIQQIMGTGGENRWVIDQVMDKDGPEVFRHLSRAVDSLFE